MTDQTAPIDKGKEKLKKDYNALQRLQIEYVPIDLPVPNEYNPNRQSPQEFELLCKSITEDGFTQPILVMKGTNRIVDGEHRWRAAHALGFKEMPVVFVDMTDAQRKISTLRHNRARGSEDIQLTADLMRDLEKLGAMDWAKDSLMLSETEVERLLDDIPPTEAFGSDREFSEAWQPTKISEGAMGEAAENVVTASTEQARIRAFAREDKLKTAKTEEERTMAKKEERTITLTLSFAEPEFVVVKKALGENPAATLLEWCKEKSQE